MSISGKVLNYLFILFCLILIVNLVKNTWRLIHVGGRIKETDQKLKQVKEENQKLKDQLSYYQSDHFLESEIRDKLQMAKPGEIILILPENLSTKTTEEPKITQDNQAENLPNWKKWLNLFW